MELGIALGVVAFIFVGSMVNSATKSIETGGTAGLIAGALVFGYFYWQDNKDGKGKLRKEKELATKHAPIISQMGVEQTYGFIKKVLSDSHFGDNWWQMRSMDPESGQMVAVMHWKENFGDQIGELKRQVVLTVFVRPGDNSLAEVYLEWDVVSPLNRGQADKVVTMTTQEIRNGLT